MVLRCDMGVAPFKWPKDREWEPGIHDKRSNRGMWFVLVVYAFGLFGIAGVSGVERLWNDILIYWLILWIPLIFLVIYLIIGQLSHREVKVEEVKYVEIQPERCSELVLGMLEDSAIPFLRDGPHQRKEDYWEDTFHLRGQPWEGLSLQVERNPLIARVDIASVTIRGGYTSLEQIDVIKERVDSAVMRVMLHGYELERTKRKPDLVIYGDTNPMNDHGSSHKPYDPPAP
jgi:hypothetical protein